MDVYDRQSSASGDNPVFSSLSQIWNKVGLTNTSGLAETDVFGVSPSGPDSPSRPGRIC